MGLLSQGKPLEWAESKSKSDFVRTEGIKQFLIQYEKQRNRVGDNLKWGDEIEYMMVEFDDAKKECHLYIRAAYTIDQLDAKFPDKEVIWHPEFARYMLESTPGKPFEHGMEDLLHVEDNMKLRRSQAEAVLEPHRKLISCSSFPRLGLKDSFPSNMDYTNTNSLSKYFPDEAINPHPRFGTLVRNIRNRRGKKVDIIVPVFNDLKTDPEKMVQEMGCDALFPDAPDNGHIEPGQVYMDMMGFGMGCCCLQITMQAFSLPEARKIYDQLVPFAPIAMALTAATPILRGYLVDTDCRWDVIAASVDDRTESEMKTISKSRYESVSRYISDSSKYRPEYNDLDLCYNDSVYQQLIENGVDDQLAKHLSHIFIRDPLVIYEELLDQDNTKSMDHFENIQSTNWQTLRFKPPPAESDIGWRVEFRSMEVQPNDFGNAAFSVFHILLTRMIFNLDLNFYMPLSLVDENMDRSHERDAIVNQRFHFRTNVFSDGPAEISQLTIDEIINGTIQFCGIINLIQRYLKSLSLERSVLEKLEEYITYVSERASCKRQTPAKAIRDFVKSHPDYNHDSKVSQSIQYDLLKNFDTIV